MLNSLTLVLVFNIVALIVEGKDFKEFFPFFHLNVLVKIYFPFY